MHVPAHKLDIELAGKERANDNSDGSGGTQDDTIVHYVGNNVHGPSPKRLGPGPSFGSEFWVRSGRTNDLKFIGRSEAVRRCVAVGVALLRKCVCVSVRVCSKMRQSGDRIEVCKVASLMYVSR